MSNNPAYIEVLFAIWAAGAVAVPLNYKLHLKEVQDACRSCDAVLLLVDQVTGASASLPQAVEVDGHGSEVGLTRIVG